MRQRSLKVDVNDENALVNIYGGNDMNMNSEFGQHVPMFFNREGGEIQITGQYKGASIFFICNGPSFVKLNHDLLKLPGVMTFGINNGPKTFRPNFWTCVDDPPRFIKSIWLDPKITKFIPQTHFEKTIFDNERWEQSKTKVGECPNVIGYRRNEKFQAQRFLNEHTLNWGCHKDFGGGRSVMLPALRIMYMMGFRKIYLLGCDMKMSENYTYHFDEQRSQSSVNGNNNTYDRLKEEYLPQLKPIFDKEGFRVFNCNPDSNLKIFPFISFEDAIKEATVNLGDVPNERVWGMYSKPEEKVQWKNEVEINQKPHLETLQKLKNGEEVCVPPRQPKKPKNIPTPVIENGEQTPSNEIIPEQYSPNFVDEAVSPNLMKTTRNIIPNIPIPPLPPQPPMRREVRNESQIVHIVEPTFIPPPQLD